MKAKTVSLFFRGPAPDGVALYLAAERPLDRARKRSGVSTPRPLNAIPCPLKL